MSRGNFYKKISALKLKADTFSGSKILTLFAVFILAHHSVTLGLIVFCADLTVTVILMLNEQVVDKSLDL